MMMHRYPEDPYEVEEVTLASVQDVIIDNLLENIERESIIAYTKDGDSDSNVGSDIEEWEEPRVELSPEHLHIRPRGIATTPEP